MKTTDRIGTLFMIRSDYKKNSKLGQDSLEQINVLLYKDISSNEENL